MALPLESQLGRPNLYLIPGGKSVEEVVPVVHLQPAKDNLHVFANYSWARLPVPSNPFAQTAIKEYIGQWGDKDKRPAKSEFEPACIDLYAYGQRKFVIEYENYKSGDKTKKRITGMVVTADSPREAMDRYGDAEQRINKRIDQLASPKK